MKLVWTLLFLAFCAETVHGFFFACHYCRRASSHEECNLQGIQYCKLSELACRTEVKEKKYGRVEIKKGCAKLKKCRFGCRGRYMNKCNYCCFSEMCNVGGWPPPKDPCRCQPCRNGGTCVRQGNSFRCRCRPGWTGRYCDRRVTTPENPCNNNPCKNGGTCEQMTCPGRYRCVCRPGFTGTNCETRVDPCRTQPCENGGSCRSRGNSYVCLCRPGFTGSRCETEIRPCASNPCQNGGTCTPHSSGYTCTCPPGFTGTHCETGTPCFRCPERSGLFPDPLDCTKFYHCDHWIPYHKDCPANLHFNPTLKVCDWPWRAGCQQRQPTADEGRAARSGTCDMGLCPVDQTADEWDVPEGGKQKREEEEEVPDPVAEEYKRVVEADDTQDQSMKREEEREELTEMEHEIRELKERLDNIVE